MSVYIQGLVSDTLMDIGINPSLLGYDCLKEAIPLVYRDREYLRQLTTKLYPEVADRMGSTPTRVERAMRHAIETAFGNTSPDVMKQYFGNVTSAQSGKVTNATFIAVVTEHIRNGIIKDGMEREAENHANAQ